MHQIKKTFSDKRETTNTLKGKFQPVEFKMENRGGNKKVTCVYNLSTFDLDLDTLQSRIRNKLGCSVTVVEQAGASADQNYIICVQGNQIYPVSDILKSEFGLKDGLADTTKIKKKISSVLFVLVTSEVCLGSLSLRET